MPQVRIKNGPSKGQTFTISDKPADIGRDPLCFIQILDKGASRRHAELFSIGEMCFIRDLESRNGCYVNDTKVDEELLREGDRIQIGATILIFESSVEKDSADFEFSSENDENFGQTLTLRLEDLAGINISDGDADGDEGLRLRAIYKLSRILAEEADEEKLVSKVLEFCAKQVGADGSYLFVPDPKKGNIIPLGTFTKMGKKGSKISRSIIRRSLQEKRAILTSDAMSDSRFSSKDSIVMKQIHSVICAPLSATGEVAGVLYLSGDQVQQVFTEDDLEIAAAMGEMIGLALLSLRMQREQRETFINTIRVLVRASEMRDPTIKGHSDRVASYASGIANQMGLTEKERNNVQLSALLHDLGRLVVDDESFFGTGTGLNVQGLSLSEKRVIATLEIMKDMTLSQSVIDAIKYMDEKNDGSGPQGLKGDKIPLGARILAVAREFDSQANQISETRAEELVRNAIVDLGRLGGKTYDKDVVKALLIAHRNGTLYTQKLEGIDSEVVADPRENEQKAEV
ncbi:MAG: HD domain-containing phosphohydrolase [Planctomycetota bacterium]|jgi:response regulator RpfG family c-di-GMP phosphodiesterase